MPTGTTTIDENLQNYPRDGTVRRTVINWTSDAAGSVNRTVDINGVLIRVTFAPDTGNAPSAGYDVTLLDVAGVDVLMGQGADLSATTPKTTVPVMYSDSPAATPWPVTVADSLTLNVANAGNAKSGRLILYYR